MFDWLSEFIKLSREDKIVKTVVRVVAVSAGAFIIFILFMIAKSLYKGKTAKIADKEFSFPVDNENKETSSVKKAQLDTSKLTKQPVKPIARARKPYYINQKLIKRRDTSQSDQYNLQGANIDNSAVGRNATVTNNYSESHLGENDKRFILQSIPSMKKQDGISTDTIVVGLTPYSNGAAYKYELVDFLKKSGYPVISINGWIVTPNQQMKNVTLTVKDGKLEFIIGLMEKR
jgi:hypothetical protein